MDENLQTQIGGNEQPVETPTTPEAEVTAQDQPKERLYSKAEVQDLMRRRVERSHNAFFKRYGVENLKGLDELMNKSKQFSDMETEYGAIQLRNSELARENAFLKNNINPDKYEDIITHFKGAGIDFSEEQLLEALKTHPEWLKQIEQKPTNTTTITKLGSEAHQPDAPSDLERASKLLGVKF